MPQARQLRGSARLSLDPLRRRLDQRAARLDGVADRLSRPIPQALDRAEAKLAGLSRALFSLDPKRPKPGFARIDDEAGAMIASAAALSPGQAVTLVFPDSSKGAHIDGGEPGRPRTVAKAKAGPVAQGDLF